LNPILKEKITESLSSVLPITFIVFAICVFLVPLELGTVVMFMAGAVMLVLGMGLFQLGTDIAMSPLGEAIGVRFSKFKRILTIALIGVVMGIIVTVAEPDLQVLAQQIPSIPNQVVIWTVAIGVGIFLAVALLRIVFHVSLSTLLIICYIVVMGVSLFVPGNFFAVAFDSGGVTTGPVTVPFIMAIGAGLASVRADKNAADDSFGLVALCSVGPILAVMILGCFYNPDSAAYTQVTVPDVYTMRDVVVLFARALPHYFKEVFISIGPIVAVFFIFQTFTRHFSRRVMLRSLVGFGYTYLGLVLFLCGVNIGFAPAGTVLGRALGESAMAWTLVPLGCLIGYFIVRAEPAIQTLNHQIQSVTQGTVSSKLMNRCMSIGVAISVGIALLRVVTGLPLYYILVPGYVVALVLSHYTPKLFVGIAFDSGGVASGPMTTTFLLPLAIGACEAVGGNVMTDAFGCVAMVALTPLIAIQIMGLIYKRRMDQEEKVTLFLGLTPVECDEIVELEG